METWKPIPEHKTYLCSTTGKVKSLKTNKILKDSTSSRGYIEYCFSENGVRHVVFGHQLVAKTFIQNPENKKQINHKDGDKTNNNVNNLEWVTCSENQIHAHRILKTGAGGRNKRKILCIENHKTYKSSIAAEKDTGIPNAWICSICKNKKKSARGLHFRYI